MPRLVVRKANDLVEAKTHLTLAERKAFATAIAFTKEVEGSFAVAEISFEVLKKVLEEDTPLRIDKDFKRRLKKVLQGLKSKKELNLIEIPVKNFRKWLRENGKTDWIKKLKLDELSDDSYILCGVIDNIIADNRNEKIIVKFNSYITPLVIDLKKRYTSYELKYVLLLNSKYSSIFYELFKKNERLGWFKIAVDKLKSLLGISEEKSYRYWGAFAQKVLQPALDEINEKTDIKVKFETVKGKHGKVIEIIFYISSKSIHSGDWLKNVEDLLKVLIKSFQKAGEKITLEELAEVLLSLERVNPATAIWFLLHYPEGEPRLYAWEHIQLTENSTKIKHPDKFLESLIKDKNPELNWLLDQRTKDLIKEELKKIAEEKVKEKNPAPKDKELQTLLKKLEEKKGLMQLYYEEIREVFSLPPNYSLKDFYEKIISEGNKEKIKKLLEILS
jgi:plasmid replication initiation protein